MRDFAELYRQYRADVTRWVAASGIPQHLRVDVMQEIWVTVFRRIDKLREHPKPRAWLRRVAEHQLLHAFRSAARQQRKIGAFEAEAPQAGRACTEIDETEDIARLLARIPSDQREVFIRIVMYGETELEIAEQLQLSVNTVHSRFWRARKCIKRLMQCVAIFALHIGAVKAAERSSDSASSRTRSALRLSWVATVTKVLGLLVVLRAPGGDADATPSPATQVMRRGEADGAGPGILEAAAEDPPDGSEAVGVAPRGGESSAAAQGSSGARGRVNPRTPHDAPRPTSRAGRTGEGRSRKSTRDGRGPSSKPRGAKRKIWPEAEVSLLRRADELIAKGRPRKALKLLLEHQRAYPASELAASREFARQTALRGLGRIREADAKIRENAREFPEQQAYRHAALSGSR